MPRTKATTPKKGGVKNVKTKKRVASKTTKKITKTGSVKRRTRRFADGERFVRNDSGRIVSKAKSALGKQNPNVVKFNLRRYAIELLEDAGKLNPSLKSVASLKERMMLTSDKHKEGAFNARSIKKVFEELKEANKDIIERCASDEKYLRQILAKKTAAFRPVEV